MNSNKFNATIEKKQATLKKIMDSNYPIIPTMADRHRERVSKAADYYDELNHLCLATDKEIFIVSLNTFSKRVDAADFAIVESDGLYHMIALVGTFPENEYYLVWLESLSNL